MVVNHVTVGVCCEVSSLSVVATLARVGLEGSRTMVLSGGGEFRPSLSACDECRATCSLNHVLRLYSARQACLGPLTFAFVGAGSV